MQQKLTLFGCCCLAAAVWLLLFGCCCLCCVVLRAVLPPLGLDADAPPHPSTKQRGAANRHDSYARKRSLFPLSEIQTITLIRQARDKHRQITQDKCLFSDRRRHGAAQDAPAGAGDRRGGRESCAGKKNALFGVILCPK